MRKNHISNFFDGVEPNQRRIRRTKHTFKLSDIKKSAVKSTGFTNKNQAIKFLTDILDKK